MLDHVPARRWVIRIRQPRYGCRACGTIHQAPTPERPIAKGLSPDHVLVSKYCDRFPLFRQSQIFARRGVELGRSTLANWVGGAVWWLEPLQQRPSKHVFAPQTLFATTCRSRCSIPAGAAPRLAGSGSIPAMVDPRTDPSRRQRFTSTARIAGPSVPSLT